MALLEGMESPAESKVITEDEKAQVAMYYIREYYTVHFDGNGAESGSIQDMKCMINRDYVIPENVFSYPGHLPVGWNTEPDGSGMFITNESICIQGAPMLRVLFTTYISYGVLILAITFFQAIGKAGAASAMALLRQVLLFLPLVVLLPKLFTVPVQGVFYAQMITDLVVLLIGIILLLITFGNIRKEERLMSC